ncbi:MAG: hypothetical protein ACRDYX_20540, partial [Egibacteraceae bacterium]
GDTDESQAAVERAKDARERVVPDELDELGGLLTFARLKQLCYVADATVWLPDQEERRPGRAVVHQRGCLQG